MSDDSVNVSTSRRFLRDLERKRHVYAHLGPNDFADN